MEQAFADKWNIRGKKKKKENKKQNTMLAWGSFIYLLSMWITELSYLGLNPSLTYWLCDFSKRIDHSVPYLLQIVNEG